MAIQHTKDGAGLDRNIQRRRRSLFFETGWCSMSEYDAQLIASALERIAQALEDRNEQARQKRKYKPANP